MCWFNSSRRLYCAVCTLVFFISGSLLAFDKYVLPCQELLLLESEKIMMNQIGKTEKSGNKGVAEIYLASVGLEAGNPYCAAGQYYCFVMAAKELSMPSGYIPIIRTGLSRKILSDAVKRGLKVRLKPARHDLIIWRRTGSTLHGHIERIISTGKAGWVTTVGFNVSIGSCREGVAVKKRNLYYISGKLQVAGLVGFKENKK